MRLLALVAAFAAGASVGYLRALTMVEDQPEMLVFGEPTHGARA
jgi:hypothetical protein